MAAITDLATLTAIAGGDWLVVNDVSASSDKKITRDDLLGGSGTWTPVLNFGGATTGITYGTQSGVYWRLGAATLIRCWITLTSKGSATGTATITGLPVASTVSLWPAAFYFDNMATMTTAHVIVSGSAISLYRHAYTASAGFVTDAYFTNTSTVVITGIYA